MTEFCVILEQVSETYPRFCRSVDVSSNSNVEWVMYWLMVHKTDLFNALVQFT